MSTGTLAHLYMPEDSGEISLRHTRYCLVLRRFQLVSSFNYSPVVIAHDRTAWSFKSRGEDLIHRSILFCQRVVQYWNSLLQRVVDAISLQSHRSRDISTTLQDMGIKGFAHQAHHCGTRTQKYHGGTSAVPLLPSPIGLEYSQELKETWEWDAPKVWGVDVGAYIPHIFY